MDVFIEKIVEKKRGPIQVLGTLGMVLASVFVAYVLMFVVAPMLPIQIGTYMLLPALGVFFLAYRLAVAQNVEFEYSMVNCEIDVDKIINRRSRKRLTTVDVKGLEAFGISGECTAEYNKYLSDIGIKKIFACADKTKADNYFLVYYAESVKTMLVFEPSDEMVEIIKKFNPKRV